MHQLIVICARHWQITEPKAQALFETSAEVLIGCQGLR